MFLSNHTYPQIILISIFFIASSAYIAFIKKLPYKADFILKALPIICLAAVTLFYVPISSGSAGLLLFLGLIFSIAGDVSLSFDETKGLNEQRSERNFIIGLGAFLIAHVFYANAFSLNIAWMVERLPWMSLLLVLMIAMLVVLLPKLGSMKIPVVIYMIAIFAMVAFAIFWQGKALMVLITGAFLFMLSDAMIAIDKFIKPLSLAKYFIMSTYYMGQMLIVWAFLFDQT